MKSKKIFKIISIAIFASLFLILLRIPARAQENLANVQYPIKELGNCGDESACRTYCNNPNNTEACVKFAENNNLMSKEEIDSAKKFIAAGEEGPGGCTSKESCENYCNDANRLNECIAFAEKSGIMPPQELEEAKKVQAALGKGAKMPGGCRNKKACDAYCSSSEHMEECITFAEASGMIPENELADAKKMIEAIKKGAKPPACNGKAECDAYCSQESHFEECVTFAEAAGFMSADDAKMARKTGGKGPGGCKGKEECDAFCQNPENQETCFSFGKENGLIPEEDLRKMEEGKKKMQEGLSQAPAEVLDCLVAKFGNDYIDKLKNGTAMPNRDSGEKMKECFEKMGQPPKEGEKGMPPGSAGPGGCKTPEECRAFCESNPDKCNNPNEPKFDETKPGEEGRPRFDQKTPGDMMQNRPGDETMRGQGPQGEGRPEEMTPREGMNIPSGDGIPGGGQQPPMNPGPQTGPGPAEPSSAQPAPPPASEPTPQTAPAPQMIPAPQTAPAPIQAPLTPSPAPSPSQVQPLMSAELQPRSLKNGLKFSATDMFKIFISSVSSFYQSE